MSEIKKALIEVHVLHPLIGLYDESGETVAVKCACGAFSTDVLGAGLEGRHYTHVAAEQAKAIAALNESGKPVTDDDWDRVFATADAVLDALPNRREVAQVKPSREDAEVPEWFCTNSARGEGWGSRGECPYCEQHMYDGTESATEDAFIEHFTTCEGLADRIPVKPSREDVEQALRRVNVEQFNWRAVGLDAAFGAFADSVLALLPGRTEAEVKAEALREAAEELQRNMDETPGTRPLVATIPVWLRGRGVRIERGDA